jgi:hypothetical protein
MKITISRLTVPRKAILASMALTLLGTVTGGFTPAADESRIPAHLSGLLNDYTPPSATTGPYEMHGKWSLHLNEERRTASFSADMTMEIADFANPDPNHDPTQLSPHTHHIAVKDAVVHNDLTDPINWTTACPIFKPPVTRGFVVTGTAFVTGNGGNPPFGNPSAVTICVLGGMQNASITTPQAFIDFSNFTLKFGTSSPASSHFGAQAINGVVSRCASPRNRESGACRVAVVE